MESLAAPHITRLLADDDLDGLVSAAILLRLWPEAELIWGDPAGLRAGEYDHVIDRGTALCDLPWHEQAGLLIDHHITNRPDLTQVAHMRALGQVNAWMDVPSATRAAWTFVRERGVDMDDLDKLVDAVDRVDGGGVALADMRSPPPALRLAKAVAAADAQERVAWAQAIAAGPEWQAVLRRADLAARLAQMTALDDAVRERIVSHTTWVDGLAIVRLDGTGLQSNGYLACAELGDACTAVCIVHGGGGGDRPTSASFYRNAFNGRSFPWDLTVFARVLDPHGGGHQTACGCRIVPAAGNERADEADVQRHVALWTDLWTRRDAVM